MTTIRGWAGIRPDYNGLIRFGHTSTETDELNPLWPFRPSAPDPIIDQARGLGLTPVIDVAQVEEHIAPKRGRDPVEVQRSKLVPLGDDHQRVGTLGRDISVVGELHAGQHLLRLVA